MDLGLDEKVVLITGGSDGLGLSLAETLLDEGASVAICGRSEERLAAAVQRLGGSAGRLRAIRCDVTEPDDIEALVDEVSEHFGVLDGLVNNAGRSAAFTLASTSDEIWLEDLDLKLHAHVRLIRGCLPLLEAADSASVINILAVAGKAPGAGSLPTSVSRAASLALTKALSKELGPHGIRVNALLIGLVRSGQWVRWAEAGGRDIEQVYEELAAGAQIPLGRVGQAHEFAAVATFLLSPRSSYVTGTGINLDGGMSPVS